MVIRNKYSNSLSLKHNVMCVVVVYVHIPVRVWIYYLTYHARTCASNSLIFDSFTGKNKKCYFITILLFLKINKTKRCLFSLLIFVTLYSVWPAVPCVVAPGVCVVLPPYFYSAGITCVCCLSSCQLWYERTLSRWVNIIKGVEIIK